MAWPPTCSVRRGKRTLFLVPGVVDVSGRTVAGQVARDVIAQPDDPVVGVNRGAQRLVVGLAAHRPLKAPPSRKEREKGRAPARVW